jgi:hypothetical protein
VAQLGREVIRCITKRDWLREEVVAILVISHAACLLLGGTLGFVFAAICAMASDKDPQGHPEFRGASAEDQIVSDQARLTSLPPPIAPSLCMSDNVTKSPSG